MAGKPKVHIDQDGDGDTDVSVDVDTGPGAWPTGVREQINMLVGRMEPVVAPPNTRITYANAREALRGILANNP
jgi:hypothetical protein